MTLALHSDFDRPAVLIDPGRDLAVEVAMPGSYGGQRPNWTVVALIVMLHVAGLAGLVALDVVPALKARRAPVVVELIPEQLAPPPKPTPPTAARRSPSPTTPPPPVIAATPVVAVPAAPAIVIPPPAPSQPVVAAPVSAAAPAPPAPPAPIIPPDADAATGRNPPPDYPIESRRRHEQGVVRLRVTITPEGRVKAIEVARSSGFDRLDQAALRAVRAWLFRPGTQAGVPVEAVGALSIPFRLT